ncbi:sodium:solute symporter family transporter [Stieleria marina]
MAPKAQKTAPSEKLDWTQLPPLPNSLGVAGPFAGVHNDALIIAGGANFPQPIWESEKQWLDQIHVLTRDGDQYQWHDGGKLERNIAYGASVSTPYGLLCIGGNDSAETFDEVFFLQWDNQSNQIVRKEGPRLPKPCAFTAAAMVGTTVYVAGGQTDASLDSAMQNFWSYDITHRGKDNWTWTELPPIPGPTRALNLTVSQHNGYDDCVYVISGRRQQGNQTDFLTDTWQYNTRTKIWKQRANAPQCVMAGTAINVGQSHVFVLGGADGSNFHHGAALQDRHPGFPKSALAYHTITDTWIEAGTLPANQVTTTAVRWDDKIIIPSGEIRPKVRSPKIWSVVFSKNQRGFGAVNYLVLVCYLLGMVGVGVFLAKRNKNTEQFFRGGKHIPWWAAGCSIFATMLSSLTFTGVPSKAFAQDWVYAIGNLMIPLVAVIAVFVALPFFRRIDATSAYEYLELRFSRPVRWFGSISFTLFHVFRMAVVMSLTGLALAAATPLSPAQCVIAMGVLSMIYCTLGGIEAVIWTDTIQTVVLLGGALLAIALLISGVDGGFDGFLSIGKDADKFRLANWHGDATNVQLAFWVIVVGAIGQNISSYTADQAVVQRYMTTSTQKLAARSIWVNALLTIPATLLFFGIGSALFAYYHTHPEKLDPTATTDQIFPLFIAQEMPIGIAGLLVAGIFAAAQSTVSTSMNSTATSIVSDFLQPLQLCKSDQGYLRAAKALTLTIGILGTVLALFFVAPDIKSLFDQFIKVIGLFMGVLGGLFVLGATTKRANGPGAMIGAIAGATVMFWLWKFSNIQAYLFTTVGITSCVVIGYLASLPFAAPTSIQGLTIHTLSSSDSHDDE